MTLRTLETQLLPLRRRRNTCATSQRRSRLRTANARAQERQQAQRRLQCDRQVFRARPRPGRQGPTARLRHRRGRPFISSCSRRSSRRSSRCSPCSRDKRPCNRKHKRNRGRLPMLRMRSSRLDLRLRCGQRRKLLHPRQLLRAHLQRWHQLQRRGYRLQHRIRVLLSQIVQMIHRIRAQRREMRRLLSSHCGPRSVRFELFIHL